ncbi:hypothetical protein QJS66_12930 [Kocuria rhizophila]|nr:hypothetical protein QJS66_12930 [Kocuria rhizophila]
MERGQVRGVSGGVLAGDRAGPAGSTTERAHLLPTSREESSTPRPARPAPVRVPVALQQLLDAIVRRPPSSRPVPLDIVAANDLGRTLYRGIRRQGGRNRRYVFFDDDAARLLGQAGRHRGRRRGHAPRRRWGPGAGRRRPAARRRAGRGSEAFARAGGGRGVRRRPQARRELVHDADAGARCTCATRPWRCTGMPGTRLFGTRRPDHPATRRCGCSPASAQRRRRTADQAAPRKGSTMTDLQQITRDQPTTADDASPPQWPPMRPRR